jgi:ABC-type phosphate/phosphonate transport system ATPase subunit
MKLKIDRIIGMAEGKVVFDGVPPADYLESRIAS